MMPLILSDRPRKEMGPHGKRETISDPIGKCLIVLSGQTLPDTPSLASIQSMSDNMQ